MHTKEDRVASIARWSLFLVCIMHFVCEMISSCISIVATYYSNKPNCMGIIAIGDGLLLMQDDHQTGTSREAQSPRAIIAWLQLQKS